MLLEGPGGTSDIQDILSDLPPRNIVDRLIFRYFNSAEYSIGNTATHFKGHWKY